MKKTAISEPLVRRTFIKSVASAASATMLLPNLSARAAEQSTNGPKSLPSNWLWMRPSPRRTDDQWKQFFEQCKSAGIDAVVPEVYNGSTALFEHPNPLVKTRAALLEKMIPLAHNAGVQVHAWMWTMPCNNGQIVENHGDWYAVNGLEEPAHKNPAYVGYYKFLCPRREAVREFVKGTVAGLSSIPDLDGVHLDYVRLPDVILAKGLWAKYDIVQDKEYPQYDYCYCQQCREEFKSQSGIDPLKDLKDPSANAAWRQFRYDGVSEMVKQHLAPKAREHGKAITAAVFPNWQYVRQAWHTWQLDAYLPMLYHTFYQEDIAWIGEQTRAAKERLVAPAPIYPGLMVSALKSEQLALAIESGRNGGGSGIALFDAGALGDSQWDTLTKALKVG